DDVIGAVELLALVVRGEGGDPAVGLGARHLARRMLAREQAPLPVPGEPVGHVARLAVGADAVPRRPPPEMIAWHVAPEQVVFRRMPQRALGEQAASGDPLERDVGPDDLGEARVPDRDAHCFIRSPGLPATYQSGGSTSSTTTQTASLGSLVTSVIASLTRLAISSLRSLPQPSYIRMFTNGMAVSLLA